MTERYGPSIWQLPEGTAANVDQAWRAAAPLVPAGDDRGGGLLSHQQQLRGWAADTQKRIPGWIAYRFHRAWPVARIEHTVAFIAQDAPQ